MKVIKSVSFLFFIPLLISGKVAEAQTEEKGLLWEISGNGLKKPSYLYGTIHIQDKKVFQYGSVVEQKLKSCKAFAPELILDEINQLELLQTMTMTDNSLDKLLSPEDYQKLDRILKEKMGVGADAFKQLKPFMLAAQLGQTTASENDMPMALDMHLLQIARDNKLKTFAVEKLEEQIAAINSISVEDQAKMLIQMLEDTATSDKEYDKLLSAYLSQDLGQMTSMTEDPGLPKAIQEQFLNARNRVMAQRIGTFVKEQTTFIAIGAAHLGGSDGVIGRLKANGFTLKPIPFVFKD